MKSIAELRKDNVIRPLSTQEVDQLFAHIDALRDVLEDCMLQGYDNRGCSDPECCGSFYGIYEDTYKKAQEIFIVEVK